MGEDSDVETEKNDAESTGDESRRQFLRAIGATSAIAGVGGLAGAQETTTEADTGTTAASQQTTTVAQETTTAQTGDVAGTLVLGGRREYWLGTFPGFVEGERNPTLPLLAGNRYRIVWVNLDGVGHRFQLLDGEGNVVEQTRTASQQGATRTLVFEATEEMAAYRCEFHPELMRGAVELGAGFPKGETTEAETTEAETTEAETAAGDEETTTDGSEGTTPAGGETVDVAVGPEGNYLQFVPEKVEISVGDTVRWTAKSVGHNVSCKPEADPKVQLPESAEPFATYEGNRSFMILQVGETFEHTFTVPGTYVYVCVPHADQGMIGRVVVTE